MPAFVPDTPAASAPPASKPKAKPSLSPAVAAATCASTGAPVAEPSAGGALTRQPSKAALTKQSPGLLSLEDTISAATALAVLRGEAVILHIETAGPDPLRDEVLAIHVRRVRKHWTIAELRLKVMPLRALPAAAAEDGLGEAGRPPAKGQDVALQEAVSRLLAFLGTHRQHVFVHNSAGAQAFLGQAARQYGMAIENPVGDLVDLARLAWPDRADYSLSGLASDLLPELGTATDATKAIQGLLQAASKVLTANGVTLQPRATSRSRTYNS